MEIKFINVILTRARILSDIKWIRVVEIHPHLRSVSKSVNFTGASVK